MKISFVAVAAALAAGVNGAALEARSSPSWAGTNSYFLHGMSEAAQDAFIAKLVSYNAKVLRLWVNGLTNGACQKGSKIVKTIPPLETQLGSYNNAALDELDKLLVKLSSKNIKAIISPHDANSLLGDYRKDVYFDNFGAGYFYERSDAFQAYDNRLSHILNYKGATSGKVWKNWPEAIFSFNLQNEPMAPSASHCTNNDPNGWFCGRANHMRSELGANNRILISTGGAGGDYSHNCNFLSAVTNCAAIDAISIHRYASVPGNWASSTGGWISQAKGKKVFVEEWGIDSTKYARNDAFPSEVGNMNSAGLPGLYWEILPAPNGGCSYDPKSDSGDPFGILTSGTVNLAGPINQATSSTAAQDWTGSIY